MKVLIVSSSHGAESRSERLAVRCAAELEKIGVSPGLVRLKDYALPAFDNGRLAEQEHYRVLHRMVAEAEALVLASPVYNWGLCAELKKFIEYVGSSDGTVTGAFFDKVVTFVNAAGLPHSYMAFGGTALALMLDFKCVINPYHVYVHNRHWEGEELLPEAEARLRKSMEVAVELGRRSYRSGWEI